MCTAGRGAAFELDRARVRGLDEVVPEALHPLDTGADLLLADGLGVDVGDSHRAVLCEQRREAVVVAHHHRVGELTAQRLDLDAVSNGLKVAHRFPPCLLRYPHDRRAAASMAEREGAGSDALASPLAGEWFVCGRVGL